MTLTYDAGFSPTNTWHRINLVWGESHLSEVSTVVLADCGRVIFYTSVLDNTGPQLKALVLLFYCTFLCTTDRPAAIHSGASIAPQGRVRPPRRVPPGAQDHTF